jgi:hypothetical protein
VEAEYAEACSSPCLTETPLNAPEPLSECELRPTVSRYPLTKFGQLEPTAIFLPSKEKGPTFPPALLQLLIEPS